MAWLERPAPQGARCVFHSLCDHAPAEATMYHEFAPYAPKHLCKEHTAIVERGLARLDSKLRHPSVEELRRVAKRKGRSR